jgi:hypothetical protein
MADRDFGLVRRFLIDDGQLDGFAPHECFVLGYELAIIDKAVSRGESFSQPVHSANRERIEVMLKECRADYRFTWMQDDRSEMWVQLDIKEV